MRQPMTSYKMPEGLEDQTADAWIILRQDRQDFCEHRGIVCRLEAHQGTNRSQSDIQRRIVERRDQRLQSL